MVEIKQIQEMKIIGVKGKSNLATTMQDIPPLWMKLMKNQIQIQNKVNEKVCYGICTMIDKENFWELAGFEVSELNQIPEDMIGETTPSMKVACFIHKGKVELMAKTYEDILNNILLKENLEADWSKPSIEMYDERFKEDSDESECEIWIPIK